MDVRGRLAALGWCTLLGGVVSGCAPNTPPLDPVAAPKPPSAQAAVAKPAVSPAPAGFGFWLLGQSTFKGTLYGVAPTGEVTEAETVTGNDQLWTEAVGTLHWVEECATPGGCDVRRTCPLQGRIAGSAPTPTSPCDSFVLELAVTCSDGRERNIKASFDGACERGEEPTAHIYVNGEPGTDGRLPGWDRITAARYRLCERFDACRAEIARSSSASSAFGLGAPF